jgi:response regulator of citrate/malate metabolism
MGWFFIIVGGLLFVFTVGVSGFMYLSNPVTRIRWERRLQNYHKRKENRHQLREIRKKYRKIEEKKEERKEEKTGLSEQDIERIQKKGLHYIE